MKKLRSGYTTGACAAAAAKAAAEYLFSQQSQTSVTIPFPDGQRVTFTVEQCGPAAEDERAGYASVIKDAGDDPDVTNGAEICAAIRVIHGSDEEQENIVIRGGKGVGTITKRGLAVEVGSPAINPVPQQMIRQAVSEVLCKYGHDMNGYFDVEISVPNGEELAKKTLNARLGILGGISILGSSGIVKPVSAKAWTDTISAAIDVAAANGHRELVLSTGRTSEAAMERSGRFKEEMLIMMGDYLEYALKDASRYDFLRLHMAGMWAKTLKAAMRTPQTHVRFGALEAEMAQQFIAGLHPDRDLGYLSGANTAREMYERLMDNGDKALVVKVCEVAKDYHQDISGLPVSVYLIHHTGKIVVTVV